MDHTFLRFIYRLTRSASELSGFTCTSSLTMSCGVQNFELIVRERVQLNPDNSISNECANFFIIQIEYTVKKKLVKVCNDSGVLNFYHGYCTTIMTSRRLFRHNPVSRGTNQPIRNRNSCSV